MSQGIHESCVCMLHLILIPSIKLLISHFNLKSKAFYVRLELETKLARKLLEKGMGFAVGIIPMAGYVAVTDKNLQAQPSLHPLSFSYIWSFWINTGYLR
ncbi:hypothetical protein I4U23_026500 [Adineta vaga]|nr:hypothetical protein I4U23_026500 [Adineta vaga]